MRQRLAVRPPGIRKGHRLVCAGTGRFPAPRIARTERLPVGETAKVHWRPCNLWELTPRERQRSCGSESFRAPLPRARWRARLSPLRILPPEIFFTAVFAPRTGPSVRSGSASARRGLPHPGVRGERQKFSPAGAPDGSACPLRGTRRGNNRWHDFPLRRGGRDSHRDRDCQAFLPLWCLVGGGAGGLTALGDGRRCRPGRLGCGGIVPPLAGGRTGVRPGERVIDLSWRKGF